MTITKTPIVQMNRFAGMWKVWLECGHTFECSPAYAKEYQLYIGKPVQCLSCYEERKDKRK